MSFLPFLFLISFPLPAISDQLSTITPSCPDSGKTERRTSHAAHRKTWELLNRQGYFPGIAEAAADEIVTSHDNDFELLWNTLNRTDMMVLAGMSAGNIIPLTDEFGKLYGSGAVSTVFSALQRLMKKGMIIKEGSSYFIDDPFFRRWIRYRRNV